MKFKFIRIFVGVMALLVCDGITYARISVGSFPEQDSLMMSVKDVEEVDPLPYEQGYREEMNKLKTELKRIEKYENVAQFYISMPVSGSQGSFMGNLRSLMSEAKSRNSVTTPEQREFVGMLLENIKSNNNSVKDAQDIEKKLGKGKLSDKAKPYIQEYYRESGKLKQNVKEKMARLQALNKEKGVVECMLISYPEKQIERRMVSFRDTVLNLSWRPWVHVNGKKAAVNSDDEFNPFKTAYDDEKKIKRNWEWALNEKNPEASEQFPVSVDYSYSDKHPDLRIVSPHGTLDRDVAIYDKKGNLVAIPLFSASFLTMGDENLAKNILAYAYRNNELDIKNCSAHAQHYVKVQSGIEQLTAKEKQASERASTALANALLNSMKADMKYGKNSRKAKAAGRKNAGKAVGALLSNSDFYDDSGYRWISQVKSNYNDLLKRPYKTERISDTAFRTVYVGKDGKGLFEIITEYKPTKPYHHIQTYTIRSLSGTRFYSTEDLESYKGLISERNSRKNTNKGASAEREEKKATVGQGAQSRGGEAGGITDDSDVFLSVEQSAEFPGGSAALMKYLSNNIKYPEAAKAKDIQGRVLVKFIIEEDGSITSPVIAKGVDPDLDSEAIRVVKRMPRWQPGKNGGQPVRSYYFLPITFRVPTN